jgi:hypothetical protein
MEIQINREVIDTVCNSLRASRQSLRNQLRNATDPNKKEIIEHQLADVEKALRVFEHFED